MIKEYELIKNNYGLEPGAVFVWAECPGLYMLKHKDGVINTHRFTPAQMDSRYFKPSGEKYYTHSEVVKMQRWGTSTITYRFYDSKYPENYGIVKINGQKVVSETSLNTLWDAKKNK